MVTFLRYFLPIMLLAPGLGFCQTTPRIKDDPQFDRDLAVASYLYALDLMVGLTSDQAVRVEELIRPGCQPDRWQPSIISAVCRGDQLASRGLWKHKGLDDILTDDQKRYFETYNRWKHRSRIKNFTTELYIANIEAQIRSTEESKYRLLEQELGLSEKKVKLLRVLSKRKIRDSVDRQVTARRREEKFRLALAEVPEGASLVDAFKPGGALELFDSEYLKEFLTLDKLANQHPAVAVRPDQPDWYKFVGKTLNRDEMARLGEFRKKRDKRQARYIAHVFVAEWTRGMDLEYQDRVALMELLANNLSSLLASPPFWPSLYLSRVKNKAGLRTVPREEYVAIVGEENIDSLMRSIGDTKQYW